MPDSPTSEIDSDFVCDCHEWMRPVCAGERFYKEHKGTRYCVLHCPDKDKGAAFARAVEKKLLNQDFDFRGVWFPAESSFNSFEFTKAADFQFATFSAKASFDRAASPRQQIFATRPLWVKRTFSKLTFKDMPISPEQSSTEMLFLPMRTSAHGLFSITQPLDSSRISRPSYSKSALTSCKLRFAQKSIFTTLLSLATSSFQEERRRFFVTDVNRFSIARFERPDCVSFHTLELRPHWFANLDTRKLTFINVDWPSKRNSVALELIELQRIKVLSPYRLLAIIYAQLAVNAEDNQRYEEASNFRYLAMDVRRIQSFHGLAFWKLSWWYWVASGYGERVVRAFVVLVAILTLAAAIYMRVGFSQPELRGDETAGQTRKLANVDAPLKFGRALTYSAGVMTLQKPEPKPATTTAQAIVLLETILGPVQAALLALAIRRKFMR